MVTGVWQLLKKMAGGNLSLPETNCGTSLVWSSVAEPQVRQFLPGSKSCKLISWLNPTLKGGAVGSCFKHKAYWVMPSIFTLVIPSDFVEGF
jgi:hypothetical protein